jgi:hypothetical protein
VFAEASRKRRGRAPSHTEKGVEQTRSAKTSWRYTHARGRVPANRLPALSGWCETADLHTVGGTDVVPPVAEAYVACTSALTSFACVADSARLDRVVGSPARPLGTLPEAGSLVRLF